MSEHSKIEWTDATWNPVLGCSDVSSGCANCYAKNSVWRMSHNPNAKIAAANAGLTERLSNGRIGWTGRVNCIEERLRIPLHWKQPRRIFVNSQSDLFHPEVPFEFVDQVFAIMSVTPQHTYQVLTKRPERMAEYLQGAKERVIEIGLKIDAGWDDNYLCWGWRESFWPLKNVWLGTSCEDQKTADERVPHLLACPGAVHFISAEPLLGPVCISDEWLPHAFNREPGCSHCETCVGRLNWQSVRPENHGPFIRWVIVGGESGIHARPIHPDWARWLRDQCQTSYVPFFFKQWGQENTWQKDSEGKWEFVRRAGKKSAGRLLDGREWNEMPEVGA